MGYPIILLAEDTRLCTAAWRRVKSGNLGARNVVGMEAARQRDALAVVGQSLRCLSIQRRRPAR